MLYNPHNRTVTGRATRNVCRSRTFDSELLYALEQSRIIGFGWRYWLWQINAVSAVSRGRGWLDPVAASRRGLAATKTCCCNHFSYKSEKGKESISFFFFFFFFFFFSPFYSPLPGRGTRSPCRSRGACSD
jgi:hypothetical protein